MIGLIVIQILSLIAYYRRFAVEDWHANRMKARGLKITFGSRRFWLIAMTGSQLAIIGWTVVSLFSALVSAIPDRGSALELGIIDALAVSIFLAVFATRSNALR